MSKDQVLSSLRKWRFKTQLPTVKRSQLPGSRKRRLLVYTTLHINRDILQNGLSDWIPRQANATHATEKREAGGGEETTFRYPSPESKRLWAPLTRPPLREATSLWGPLRFLWCFVYLKRWLLAPLSLDSRPGCWNLVIYSSRRGDKWAVMAARAPLFFVAFQKASSTDWLLMDALTRTSLYRRKYSAPRNHCNDRFGSFAFDMKSGIFHVSYIPPVGKPGVRTMARNLS